jgi:hypothetical protein
MVIFGPVLDASGSWGLGVVEAGDEQELRAFAADDPVVTTDTGQIDVGKLLGGFVPGHGRSASRPRTNRASAADSPDLHAANLATSDSRAAHSGGSARAAVALAASYAMRPGSRYAARSEPLLRSAAMMRGSLAARLPSDSPTLVQWTLIAADADVCQVLI